MAHEKDPDRLVELTVFPTDMEAQLLVARLDDYSIRAEAFGTATKGLGFMSPSTMPHGGVQVRVRHADLEQAKTILQAFMDERLDPENAAGGGEDDDVFSEDDDDEDEETEEVLENEDDEDDDVFGDDGDEEEHWDHEEM